MLFGACKGTQTGTTQAYRMGCKNKPHLHKTTLVNTCMDAQEIIKPFALLLLLLFLLQSINIVLNLTLVMWQPLQYQLAQCLFLFANCHRQVKWARGNEFVSLIIFLLFFPPSGDDLFSCVQKKMANLPAKNDLLSVMEISIFQVANVGFPDQTFNVILFLPSHYNVHISAVTLT